MGNTTSVVLKRQGLFENFLPKKWENPFPDFILEDKLSLKLVGYARTLVKVSSLQKKYSLSLSDDYLSVLWGDDGKKLSRSSVQRRLTELQNTGLFFITTGEPQRLPDGSFRQDRTITLIPQRVDKKISSLCVKNDTPNKNTSFGSIRTIQKKGNSPSNFIDTNSLKKIEPEKKQNPDKLVRRIQISFMKKMIDRVIEKDEVDYRFMCLFLRTCLGANEQTIKYYGSVLHFNLRLKPEVIISTLELMIKSYSGIRKPVGFFISEIQSSLGLYEKKKVLVEFIQSKQDEDENVVQDRPKRDIKKLEERFNKLRIVREERKVEQEKRGNVLPPIKQEKNKNKKDLDKILSLFRRRIE